METYFNLNEIIKNMILTNKSLDEICNELNFDRKYLITLLKGIKSDILLSYDCESFYMLEIIDRVLYEDREVKHIMCSVDNNKKSKIMEFIINGYNGVDILRVLGID